MDAHIKLREWWARTGADVTTWPAPDAAIVPITQRYDLTLPEDFHRYLAMGSPVAENWDDQMGNWWPVGRIKNMPDEYKHALPSFIPNHGRKFLFFLDYCIWCWAWAISCEEGPTFGKVVLINGTNAAFVADTFSEFVDRYITDWASVN